MKKQFSGRASIMLAISILPGIVNPVAAEDSGSTPTVVVSTQTVLVGTQTVVVGAQTVLVNTHTVLVSTQTVLVGTQTEPGTEFHNVLRSSREMGPKMVVLPSGSFRMGCLSSDEDCEDDEKPTHDVQIKFPFAVSVYEVTFEDYDRFCPDKADDNGWGRGRRPVINVSWEDALAYAAWLSRQTGEDYRLLSESEWEYAARARSTTKYSWGDEIGVDRANCDEDGCGDGYSKTAPVGSFKPNAFGLYDMHGNVWEWVEDCWPARYDSPYRPRDGSAQLRGDCGKRVLRGGSWDYAPRPLRSAYRGWSTTDSWSNRSGFRVARTLAPWIFTSLPLAGIQGGNAAGCTPNFFE